MVMVIQFRYGTFYRGEFTQLPILRYNWKIFTYILFDPLNREAEYGATSQGGFEPKISGVILPDIRASIQSNSGI
jgi:hypothetical protein